MYMTDIAKRLLNVVTVAAIAAFLYGSGQIVRDTTAYLTQQKTHCANEQALRRIQEGRLSEQTPFVPPHLEIDADPENILLSIDLLEVMCTSSRPILDIVSPAKTMGTISLSLLLIAVIGNYILFGKITLWNRAPPLSKDS